MPAVSPTECEPSETGTAPVVPPQAAFAPVPAVALSICRLNLPVSVVGAHTLFTVNVGRRVFVIVHTLFSPAARDTVPSAAQAPPITFDV